MARPPQDHQIRIQEILDAAEPLFYSKGYHDTAISDIAKVLGVAQGTIYYYFKSKETILESLIQRHIDQLISQTAAIAADARLSPLEKFERALQSLFASLQHPEGLLLEFLYNDQTLHLVDKVSRQGKTRMTPFLLKIIDEGCRQQKFSVNHPQAAVNLVLALLDGLIDAMYEKIPPEVLECQFALAERLLAGILGTDKINLQMTANP